MLSPLLSTVFLSVLFVFANPVVVNKPSISVPITKRVNLTGTRTLLERDQRHITYLRARAQTRLNGTPLSGDAVVNDPAINGGVDYTVTVEIGNPPTSYTLLIDTGSSNTWIGANQTYIETSTSVGTSNQVSVGYGSGSFSGAEFTDRVAIGSKSLTIAGQSIGVASESEGFDGVDGILGIGPVDLTVGTLYPDESSSVPTVTDNLFSQGVITQNIVSASFEPTQSLDNANGELTFGGTDTKKFVGSISFSPITSTYPASVFWGIDQSVRYGQSAHILSLTAGIVDTGTTLTLIASDAFEQYQDATGAVLDDVTGLLCITPDQLANIQSLFFTINHVVFEFTANAQIWPRALNTAIGGNSSFVYLIVGDLGSPSGEGLDFINGMTFLERFYSVFDTTNRRVGLAQTAFTRATSN